MSNRRDNREDLPREVAVEIARAQLSRHYGFGWCPDCQEWQHCAGEDDASKRHEASSDAHVCVRCGERLQDLPPF